MNDREKLIELLNAIIGCGYEIRDRVMVVANSEIADHLIANGVTIQKRGKWAEKMIPLDWCEDDVDIVCECSECSTSSCGISNYCPNCGTKMEG